MKCAKWKSEKWNDNLSYFLINIRRMEVSLDIFKVSGLSDPTSEMVSSYSSWSVGQRWNHVDKLHHSPAWTRSCPTFSLWVTSIKASAWLHWCGGWGLQRWATTEIYIVFTGAQKIWLSLTLTGLWRQVLLISSMEDNQRSESFYESSLLIYGCILIKLLGWV